MGLKYRPAVATGQENRMKKLLLQRGPREEFGVEVWIDFQIGELIGADQMPVVAAQSGTGLHPRLGIDGDLDRSHAIVFGRCASPLKQIANSVFDVRNRLLPDIFNVKGAIVLRDFPSL